jgi:hypothetical protein
MDMEPTKVEDGPGSREKGTDSTADPSTKRKLADGKSVREEKRKKWLAKQEKKQQHQKTEQERNAWVQENCHFATLVSWENMDDEQIQKVLEPFKDLQENTPTNNYKESSGQVENYFIAEGTETVRLLVQQSLACQDSDRRFPPIQIKAIFVKPSSFFETPVSLIKDVEHAATANSKEIQGRQKQLPPFSVLIGSEEIQSEVVGFPFSRGALACGIVPRWNEDETWLDRYVKSHPRFNTSENDDAVDSPPLRLIALDGICDSANLGSIIRTASAFGLDAVLLSRDSCDVWSRRAVRVSMGHCCRIPIIRVYSLTETIQRLKKVEIIFFAAVIDRDADLILERVSRGSLSGPWCIVMGNEGELEKEGTAVILCGLHQTQLSRRMKLDILFQATAFRKK